MAEAVAPVRAERGPGEWGAAVTVVVFVAAHFLLRPLLVSWTVAPDLLAGGVLFASLHARPGTAAGVGFAAGLLEGAVALEAMGALAAILALAGYGAARSRELFFADSPLFLPVYVFVGVWALRLAEQLATGSVPGWTGWVLEAPASAIITTVLVVVADRAVTPRP